MRGARGVGVGAQHHKLVTAQAAHGVLLAQGGGEPLRHLHQQVVAHVVAQRVVDIFEAVQVQKHQRHGLVLALRVGQGGADAVLQQTPVGQAGERVKVGQLADVLFVFLALADVRGNGHVVGHRAAAVAQLADGEPLGVGGAVLAAVPQLALPQPGGVQGVPHRPVKIGVLPPGRQQIGVAPQGLGLGVTGDLGEGLVDPHNPALAVGDDDGFAALLKHPGDQLQLLLGPFALNGQRRQVRRHGDEFQLKRLRQGGRALVKGKGAQHPALPGANGL